MDKNVKIERENKRKIRHRKKIRSTVVTITLMIILGTVGVVNAQTQGYDVRYNGKSLGFVRSSDVFESAVEGLQQELCGIYNNENIVIGKGFELVPGRIEDPMDFETCTQVLKNEGIELYVNGAFIFIGDQKIGIISSVGDVDQLFKTYEKLYPQGKAIRYEEATLPLSETKDFGTMLSIVKATIK